MVWPPGTHQDVQDEITPLRLAHRDYYRPGYYSLGTFVSGAMSTTTLSIDTVYARPFWVGARRTFDRVGINVSTAATAGSGAVLQLGLYGPGLGLPGPLAAQSASISTETTGSKEFTISETLDPGPWWVAVRASVAGCTVNSLLSNALNPFTSLATTPSGSAANYSSLTVTAVGTGAFPTVGWGATITTPAVLLRAA